MIEEDLTVFLADFGVSITAGAVSGLCLLDMPGEVVFDGVRETYTGALSTMYSITCLTDEFGGLGYGDSVTVDGEVYTVQEAPLLITDGVFCRINLERSAVVQFSFITLSGLLLITQDGRQLVTQ